MLQYPMPVEQVFHALADLTRCRIVERLSRGPLAVTALAEPLPMSLAAVLQHVRVLEANGIVRSEKVGRVRTCRLDSAALRAAEGWIAERRGLWEHRLDRLREVLAEQDVTRDAASPSPDSAP